MANDSFFMGDMGDLVGDLIGESELSGSIGEAELGRRRQRIEKIARRHGMVAMTKPQMAAAVQSAAVATAAQTGIPQTVGNKLATSSQRLEMVPLSSVALGAALAQTATLTVNAQRPIQPYRLILQCADSTTGADQLFSVGVTNVVLGAHNLYAAPGTTGPATAFGRDAWGTEILTVPVPQGGVIRVDLVRIAATANPGVASGMALGFAAST